jgi:hypothetical protein
MQSMIGRFVQRKSNFFLKPFIAPAVIKAARLFFQSLRPESKRLRQHITSYIL